MPCALCLRDLPLCESHIIPEFMYKQLYDDKHKMWKFSTNSDTRTTRIPKGIYEKLLCRECEIRIGTWETYVSQVLNGGVEVGYRVGPFGWDFSGVDYRPFKLFQISILWRCAVSKRKEFSQVQLERKQKSELRQMLMTENPGSQLEYACLVLTSANHRDILDELVMMPVCNIDKGAGTCFLIMGGLCWGFFIPRADSRAEEFGFVLSEDGKITVCNDRKGYMDRFFVDFALDLKKSGNLPSANRG